MALETLLATIGDIDEIMRIEAASFHPAIRESREAFLDRLRTCPECCTVLAEQPATCRGNRPLSGYLSAEIWQSVPEATLESYRLGHAASERHDAGGAVLYVSSFAVDPAARGGTGRAFFRDSIGRIRDSRPSVERIVLVVNEDWLAARRIYETEGYRYAGTIAGFFPPDARRALVMEKAL